MRVLFSILFMSLFFIFTNPNSFAQTDTSTKNVLVLGDSLTEGFGVAKTKAFPAVLGQKLNDKGKKVTVHMAGIGGATSASAPARIKHHLKESFDVLVLALGGNDGLRGVDVNTTKKYLKETIREAKKHKVKVLLAGMKVPPNYGPQYQKDFEGIFKSLAKEEGVSLMPFLLEGVGGVPELNQDDGIHPNEKGHEIIATELTKYVEPLL